MFPSPTILQHYVKFNICTIAMLEKLFGAESLVSSIGHLVCHQAILLISLGGIGLLFVIQTTTPTFLGYCCAL